MPISIAFPGSGFLVLSVTLIGHDYETMHSTLEDLMIVLLSRVYSI